MKPKHLLQAAYACRVALDPFVEDDWGAVQAGDLTWDVRQTVTHVCDAVGWYAAHLASRSPRRLRFDFLAHQDASNAELLDVLEAAAVTLAEVARAAPADARAYHDAGMADAEGFLAMGCDEILVHGWDAVRGFGREFAVLEDLAGRVLRRLFPWAPTDLSPWPALLWANGRIGLPGQSRRTGPDWVWHCAPLDEWDGTVPRQDANPPTSYEWDRHAGRWRPHWQHRPAATAVPRALAAAVDSLTAYDFPTAQMRGGPTGTTGQYPEST